MFEKTTKLKRIAKVLLILTCAVMLSAGSALARELTYTGNEETIFVKPGEPTQITFPSKIEGGFKRKNSAVNLERQENYLVVFAQPALSLEGEAIIVHLADKRTYSLRITPATGGMAKDGQVTIVDNRVPEASSEEDPTSPQQAKQVAPPSAIAGLMREMVLVAEFGKRKGIPGFRRSNRYSGETVLNDGTLEAKIDEIFMGTDLWGYVLSVENLLETGQKINPATFRLDGTRAVSADRWELSPRPLTSEQRLANAHKGKVYIITRAKRR